MIWIWTLPNCLIQNKKSMGSITAKKNMYSIGLRADGTAALNIQRSNEEKLVDKRTRIGECRGHETYIDRWLSS